MVAALLALAAPVAPAMAASTYYVGPGGTDDLAPGRGSSALDPWQTVNFAIQQIPDAGDTVLVLDGTYADQAVDLTRAFATPVTIKAQNAYRAIFTSANALPTLRISGGANYTIEGLVIGSTDGAIAVHIGGASHDVTLRNNILHDNLSDDLLKINELSHHVVVEGNLLYNPGADQEVIDLNTANDITVQDNVIFSDYAGSGRPIPTTGTKGSQVLVRNSSCQTQPALCDLWALRITVRRNIFLNWEGPPNSNFIRLGEDQLASFEAQDVVIENNLMIGNSGNTLEAPIAVTAARNVTVRHNTVTGDLPSLAYIMHLDASAHVTQSVSIDHNVWADPAGTMENFVLGDQPGVSLVRLERNAYWNNGQPIPTSGQNSLPGGALEPTDDPSPVLLDPKLPAIGAVVLPRYDQGLGMFPSGSTTIRQEFIRLVTAYAVPAADSPLIDAAVPANAATDDILGQARAGQGAAPDLGAYETPAAPPPPPVFAFKETAGQVVMEAEHFDSNIPRSAHDWTLETTKAGFSGDGYMSALPNSGSSNNSGYTTKSPELVFNVNITTSGTYYVWVRTQADTVNDDSCHAGLDGAGPASADRINVGTSTSWVWKRDTLDGVPATLTIATPGLHTIHLWMREDGLRVDKLLLRTSSSSTAPSGAGPAESVREEIGAPDTTPPLITNITATSITETTATITWMTDEPATSRVEYGPTAPAYGSFSPLDAALVTSHSVTLSSLPAETLHHFRVLSSDGATNPATSGDGTFTTAAAPPPPSGEMAFIESAGQVVMEAEHFDSNIPRNAHDWMLNTTKAGFSGDGYMSALPNSGSSNNSGYMTASPELIFNVSITTPGTYYVWLRGQADTGNDDSAHAGLDGAGPASADRINMGTSTSWVWKRDTLDGVPATLAIPTPGLHTIHLWMREDGLRVDKLLLRTSSSATAPSGTGPAESPREGGPPPTPDTTAPVISNVVATNVTATGVTITWTTDEPATSQVEYGPTEPAYGSFSPLDATLVTSHSVSLSGLNAETLYHFRVLSSDAENNSAASNDAAFTTLAPPPPSGAMAFQEASGQVVMEAEHFDANIPRSAHDWTLQTTKAGFSSDGYMSALPNSGSTINSGYTTNSPELVFNVNVTTPGTYYLWLRTQADSGNDDSAHAGLDGAGPASADRINLGANTSWNWKRDTMDGAPATLAITTPGLHTIHLWMREDGLRVDKLLLRTSSSSTAPSGAGPAESPRMPVDTAPPLISNLAVTNITAHEATVTWTTNEPATSQVEYGPSTGYGWLTPLDATLVTNHSVTIIGLSADVLTHVRVHSIDAASLAAVSPDTTFMTAAVSSAVFQEAAGQVVLEAERYTSKVVRGADDWLLTAARTGFSGHGYVAAEPNDGSKQETGYVGVSSELIYQVQFATPGTYTVWVRGLGDTGNDDSVHAGLDGAGPASADHIDGFLASDWVWTSSTLDGVPATLEVPSAGFHTIHLWMREDGLRVDKLLLRLDPSTTPPVNAGPSELSSLPRLMAVGDSITRGSGDANSFGYRDHVQALLGFGTVEGVGTYQSPSSDPVLDVDHEGVSGNTTAMVEARLPEALAAHLPLPNPAHSRVLLHIGTNDMRQDLSEPAAVDNVADLIAMIDAHDPTIAIHVALVVPHRFADVDAKITSYNNALRTRVQLLQATKPNLYLVDMNAAFKQNPNWSTQYLADEVHPSDAGYQVMAARWRASIALEP